MCNDMKKFKGMMTSLSPHWATPKWLYNELNKEFNFDYDPCPINGQLGLIVGWGKRNYINPPYGREIIKWIEKAYIVSQGGGIVRNAIACSYRHEMVSRILYESSRDTMDQGKA